MWRSPSSRTGLTLLELVVVLGILVILASMIVPNVGGLIFQSRHVGNAAMVRDVNHALNSFVARFAEFPDHWDSLLPSPPNSTVSAKLHDQLKPLIQVTTLQPNQVESLRQAGINIVHDLDDSIATHPSDRVSTDRALSSSPKIATLIKSTSVSYGTTFLDIAFGINSLKGDKFGNEFVVLGLSAQNEMRTSTMTDIPLVQSATPYSFYARPLCVFMVPPSGSTIFRAKYLGCVLPDGTNLPDNLQKYNDISALDK